jgi:MFS transporter, PAT family, solute carrier family 33 (acetyl-CoA transportor), member 1
MIMMAIGIPMGLSGSIPMIMKENGASYQSLSLFSLVSLPFSLKLLWAPLVDSLFIPAIGRRKTWLLPVQFICGFIMIYGSLHVNDWILNTSHDKELSQQNANKLTFFFLFLYFLMATQDITVDGWALTMLSRQNVSYASTCNALGQVLGLFLANQGFIVLSDPGWCQRVLGLAQPLIDLSSFMCFWGVVFVVLTIFVMIFKKEVEPESSGETADGLYETYRHIVWIFQLKRVQLLVLILLTARIAFGPNDAVSLFKLQEYGMAKADIATISPILFCLSLTLPAVLGRQMSCQPMTMYLGGICLKVMTSFLIWCIFQLSIVEYDLAQSPNGPSVYFFVLFIVVMSMNELAGNMIFGSQTAFFAKIADPSIGGTYMTLLNTVANLGSKWPNFLALYMLPKLTISQCTIDSVANTDIDPTRLNCPEDLDLCEGAGGHCQVITDGYTTQQIFCVLFGLVWIAFFYRSINQLDLTSSIDWLTSNQRELEREERERNDKDKLV